jgi:pimeloyl-ACP methyl ester carboxylesterase
VQGLLLIATSALPETAEGHVAREKTLAAMAKDFPRFVEGVLTWSTHAADPDLAQKLRQMMLDIGPEAGTRQVMALMGRQDHRAMLSTLQIPVRILCGRQDRVTPPALSEALAQCMPAARLELLEETGHMLPCERPQVVAQVLRELIPS